MEKELFGEEVLTVTECVDGIIKIVNSDYKYSEEMQKKTEKLKKKFLAYDDKENCRRVYELIQSKLGEKNGKR